MAKGKKSAFAARALALVFALALAALAARLWVGSAPRETRASRPVSAAPGDGGAVDSGAQPPEGDALADDVATAPPQHAPYSDREREALRDAIRDAENEAP